MVKAISASSMLSSIMAKSISTSPALTMKTVISKRVAVVQYNVMAKATARVFIPRNPSGLLSLEKAFIPSTRVTIFTT